MTGTSQKDKMNLTPEDAQKIHDLVAHLRRPGSDPDFFHTLDQIDEILAPSVQSQVPWDGSPINTEEDAKRWRPRLIYLQHVIDEYAASDEEEKERGDLCQAYLKYHEILNQKGQTP